MPGWWRNSSFGAPPNSKKYVPNQIYLIWVWWLLSVMICFTAYFFLLFLCYPSQTRENPPLPKSFILSNPSGNLSPNISIYSLLRSYLFAFSNLILKLSRESSFYVCILLFFYSCFSNLLYRWTLSSLCLSSSVISSQTNKFFNFYFLSLKTVSLTFSSFLNIFYSGFGKGFLFGFRFSRLLDM